jgi:hypothetical protein
VAGRPMEPLCEFSCTCESAPAPSGAGLCAAAQSAVPLPVPVPPRVQTRYLKESVAAPDLAQCQVHRPVR